MSSINGSDRARQADELRRMREEYENQEAETAQKTKKQVRRLQEKNTDDVKSMKAAYEGRLDAIREKSRASLSAKDENHAAQTGKIREMYHEQLRRKTEENDQNMAVLRETNNSEKEKQKAIAEQQRNGLENNYKAVISEKDQEYGKFAEDARETIQSSLGDRTKKLNDRHSREMEAVAADRDRRIVELQNTGGKQKSHLETQMKDMSRRHDSEKSRMETNYRNMAQEQSKMMDEVLTGRNEALQSERGSLRDEFSSKIEEETARFDALRESLKDQTTERVDRQVRSAESATRQAKSDGLQKDLSSNRLRKLESKHLVEQYEKRIKDLERQRDDTKDLMSDVTRKRINEATGKSTEVLQAANRTSRVNQNLTVQRSREDRANLESEMKTRLDQTNERADKRIGKILDVTREGQLRESEYYNDNLAQLKNSYANELSSQRETQLEMLSGIRFDMKEKMKAQEVKAQTKLDQTVGNFEEKIKNLQESHKQEIANLKKSYESRMDQRDQGHKLESQQVIQKYELRLSAAEESHQRELEKQQRRSEQAMTDISSRMNFNKKKA